MYAYVQEMKIHIRGKKTKPLNQVKDAGLRGYEGHGGNLRLLLALQ